MLTKQEVLQKLNGDLEVDEKLEIVKWYIDHYKDDMVINNTIIRWREIEPKVRTHRDLLLLDYSMKRIKEILNEN